MGSSESGDGGLNLGQVRGSECSDDLLRCHGGRANLGIGGGSVDGEQLDALLELVGHVQETVRVFCGLGFGCFG